jgi:hypothetical protein
VKQSQSISKTCDRPEIKWNDYNDTMGGVDIPDHYLVTYSITRKRLKKYHQKIFCRIRFDSFQIICNIQETWWHTMHLQFCIEIIQKLFQKYRGATPEAMPVRPV